MIILLLALALCTSGCPIRWQRVTLNHPIRDKDASFIEPGRTTLAEILEKLGAPDQLKDSKTGPIAHYYFLDVKEFKVELLWGLPFVVPALLAVPGSARDLDLEGGGAGTDQFKVFFDSNWVARGYAFEIHSRATEFMLWPFSD